MLLALSAVVLVAQSPRPFVVRVIDEETGRGVPLAQLRPMHNVVFTTDSAGIAAIDDPILTGRRVMFEVRSHGYEYRGRVFGNEPHVMLTITPGQTAELKLHRINIAERLYRVTGAGIYQDSVRAGLPVPIREPMLNAGVLGQDTVVAAVYRGRIFWIYGDTLLPAGYNFAVSGATSGLPGQGGLAPSAGVDLEYFTNSEGLSRPMLPRPAKGLVWIEGLFQVRDQGGQTRLLATYTRQPGLAPPEECGVAVYDDSKRLFEKWADLPCALGHVSAHPFLHREGGREYWYLYPMQRVPNEWEAIRDPKRWESFTCVRGDGVLNPKQPQLDRGADGKLRWEWRAGAPRFDAREERRLLAQGVIKPDEARFALIDAATGRPSDTSASSVIWSEFRKRWILLSERAGDVYYSEAGRPEGPWPKAVRIVQHDRYNFYNVAIHPFFNEDGGRTIYFEGTYTDSFVNAKERTPLYNYNQILYRLRLDDSRLAGARQ